MLRAKIKSKQKGKTQKLLKNLSELSKQNLQVGHFEESGVHYSKFTYPQLLKIWAFGGPSGKTIKNPLAQFAFLQIMNGKFLRNPRVKKVYKKWIKTLVTESNTNLEMNTLRYLVKQEPSCP
jgi:hypothetical protein